MNSFILLFLVVLLIAPNHTFSQEITKEKDFIVHHYPSKIELEFDNNTISSDIKVVNLLTNEEQLLEKNIPTSSTVFTLNKVHPSDLYSVEYNLNNTKSNTHSIAYIAAKSASTGAMTVYFNHPVDIAYAQTQQAVNLSTNLVNMLISYINNCVATMDIAIYDSYSPSATTGIAGAINAAYTRGVQVRVIYDGSTSSTMIPLLNSAIPRLPSPTTSAYGIMHNKFVIFDANNSNANIPFVWTGSTNWTTSQINGPDKNSVIIIQDQSLALAYKIEFEEMWGSSTMTPNTTNSKFGPHKTDNTPHNFIIGGKNVQSYFSPSDGTTAKIVSAINSANTDIEIAVMDLTRTDCSGTIITRYNGGVTNSNVLVDSNNPSGNQIVTLQATLPANHAQVYSGSGIMHHKFMVVDNYNSASDPLVLVGSHNWSTSAETKNDENTLIVHDANIANQYYQAFAYLFGLAGGVITPPLSTTNSTYQNGLLKLYPNPNHALLHFRSNQSIGH
jgi:phosphatidylserine/phosphatidylglycerophosphate/cardiolipin synthase-like enzyme